jgi:ferredoxin
MADSRGRIAADQSVCMGSGLCAHIAPDHFEVEDGTVRVLDPEVSERTAAAVDEAVECCPTQALRVDAAAQG